MFDPLDGPAMFRDSRAELMRAFDIEHVEDQRLSLMFSQVGAIHALTAAVVMLTEAQPAGLYELDGWREAIPRPPHKECRSKEARRPECADRHTEDCAYADPPPEPKHKLLPIGTRVLVSERRMEDEDYPPQPWVGKVKGYDMGRTKYEIYPEIGRGQYSSASRWAFTDNRVQPHPDGPECSPEESMGLR